MIVPQDIRYAIRRLTHSPGFTAVAVATLALGIGVNSAVFSLANWVALRPVPGVDQSNAIAVIQFRNDKGRSAPVSFPTLVDLAARVPLVASMAAQARGSQFPVVLPDRPPTFAQGAFVTRNFFEFLGARMTLGRAFTAEEEANSRNAPVAVISHRFWTTHLASDSVVVGRSLRIAGLDVTIVGVAPEGFEGIDLLAGDAVWMALGAAARYPMESPPERTPLTDRNWPIFGPILARLTPGADPAATRTQMETAAAALAVEFPPRVPAWRPATAELAMGVGVPVESRPVVRRTLMLLAALASIVLLIACANVANLLLFRAAARHGELVVRQALGGSTARLVRAQLVESGLLAAAGGILGIGLAALLMMLFRGPVLAGVGDVTRVEMDWRVLSFTVAVSLLAAAVAGLLPAGALARSLSVRLAATSARVAGRMRLRNALATAQIALTLPLLILTLMLVATLRNLRAVDVGFEAERVTAFAVAPGLGGYSEDRAVELLRGAATRIAALPGVEEAALTAGVPFSFSIADNVHAEPSKSDAGAAAATAWVSGSYFETMGIPLVDGRTFDDREILVRPSRLVAVLSRTLAVKLFGNTSPIGRRVYGGSLSAAEDSLGLEVIGVVADSRWGSLKDAGPASLIYYPMMRRSATLGAWMLLRSAPGVGKQERVIRSTMAALAPSLPLFELSTLQERLDRFLAQERLLARTFTALAVIAVALSAIGLYAIVAFAVESRRREIGIRMALGAQIRAVVRMVLSETAWVLGIGVLLGVAIAVPATRLISSRLFGLAATDPAVFGFAAVALIMLGCIAALFPARTAARVDPMIVLRAE